MRAGSWVVSRGERESFREREGERAEGKRGERVF